jgi:hypothetical protein
MTYDELAKCDGVPRAVLEGRLRWAAKECKALDSNLANVQQRCTELVLEKRELVAKNEALVSALLLLRDVRALECVGLPACGDCVRCRAKALVTA